MMTNDLKSGAGACVAGAATDETCPIQNASAPETRVGRHMRQCYDPQARKYREDDEREAGEPEHRAVCDQLGQICQSLGTALDVLELGCGTGRYFKCLSGIRSLTGFDVSPRMLEEARNARLWHGGDPATVRLVQGDFYTAEFVPETFHFIYSLGVFGNGCAMNAELATKLLHALRPGGCLFFDAIDVSFLPLVRKLRLRARNRLHAMLPSWAQEVWDSKTGWLPPYIPTQNEVASTLRKAGFSHVEVLSRPARLPLGPGRKFAATAWKPPR